MSTLTIDSAFPDFFMLKNGLSFSFWVQNKKNGIFGQKKAKKGQNDKLQPQLRLLIPVENLKEKLMWREAPSQKVPFLAKKCKKRPKKASVW